MNDELLICQPIGPVERQYEEKTCTFLEEERALPQIQCTVHISAVSLLKIYEMGSLTHQRWNYLSNKRYR